MPIDKKTAKTLCTAFKTAGLSYPPESPEILTVTLQNRSGSLAHAQLVVDTWIGRSREWPKPADIAQLCAELDNPDNISKRTRESCPHCHGDGLVSVDQPYGLTAAVPCDHSGNFKGNPGVKLTPELEARYRKDMLEGDERSEVWAKNPVNPMNAPPKSKPVKPPLRKVNWNDVNQVVGGEA